jgi:hypothetical protein
MFTCKHSHSLDDRSLATKWVKAGRHDQAKPIEPRNVRAPWRARGRGDPEVVNRVQAHTGVM